MASAGVGLEGQENLAMDRGMWDGEGEEANSSRETGMGPKETTLIIFLYPTIMCPQQTAQVAPHLVCSDSYVHSSTYASII